MLGCLLAAILFAGALLCPKVALLSAPNMSSGKEAFLNHVSL